MANMTNIEALAAAVAKENQEKSCECCGVYFIPSRSSQKYCPECSAKPWKVQQVNRAIARNYAIYGRPGRNGDPEFPPAICGSCGEEFTHYGLWYKGKLFCTARCKMDYISSHTYCAQCGRRMSDVGKREKLLPGYHVWFCSDECHEQYRLDSARKKGTINICPHCGKEFLARRKYCSDECKFAESQKRNFARQKIQVVKICQYCKKEYVGSGEKYCSSSCSTNATKTTRAKLAPRQKKTVKTIPVKKKNKQISSVEKEKTTCINLCSTCRTSYAKCERMRSNFMLLPDGAKMDGSQIVSCPKFS